MKALVLEEYGKFVFKDVEEPEIGPDDVLVEVKACGICGSDVHGMDGSTGRRHPPVIMGHEASGIILKKGSNVEKWKKGNRVTFDSTVYCGKCWFCRKGKINLCENRRVLGVSCGEYRMNGAFAEHVAVPQHILYALPDKITFEEAAMVEALSIAVHATEITPVSLNDTAVVVGTGMIGLLVVQALRAKGCGKIIAVDLDNAKLEMARRFGADFAFNPESCNVENELKILTDGRGADIGFEAIGNTKALDTAVKSVRKGGDITLIGNLSAKVELPLQSVVTREITARGSCASCGEYPACLDMIERGSADVRSLISAYVPLSDGAEWFDRLYKKEQGLMKIILKP